MKEQLRGWTISKTVQQFMACSLSAHLAVKRPKESVPWYPSEFQNSKIKNVPGRLARGRAQLRAAHFSFAIGTPPIVVFTYLGLFFLHLLFAICTCWAFFFRIKNNFIFTKYDGLPPNQHLVCCL